MRDSFLNLKIYFKPDEVERWLKALEKVRTGAPPLIRGEMQKNCARAYSYQVVRNLVTEKFAASWSMRPYHPRYDAWKLRNYPQQGWWRLGDDLMKNITHFRVQNGWMGGVPNGIKDRGGKSWYYDKPKRNKGKRKEIAMYGKVAESMRPLFAPTLQEFIQGGGWRSCAQQAMRKIKGMWG